MHAFDKAAAVGLFPDMNSSMCAQKTVNLGPLVIWYRDG
jgi:hypothetical protein